MGFGGPIGLDVSAVHTCMTEYFEVKKKERLQLSLHVRSFCSLILNYKAEKDGDS